ncbi:MAG: fluoride efflux transporter CrcB [Thermoanaerobaculia bacterium]|nr:fluoride efflux transporter CrcB [Thermoanaerobaculia bacterium]
MLERLLLVAAGGALGAVARYLASGWVARLSHESPFPYGTLAVNVVGSLLLGFLLGAGSEGRFLVPPALRVFLGVGLLGAFTTFSTFSFETLEALRLGDVRVAVANVAANLLFGLPACWLGLQLGARL